MLLIAWAASRRWLFPSLGWRRYPQPRYFVRGKTKLRRALVLKIRQTHTLYVIKVGRSEDATPCESTHGLSTRDVQLESKIGKAVNKRFLVHLNTAPNLHWPGRDFPTYGLAKYSKYTGYEFVA